MLRHTILLALLPLALARPFLLGYSTSHHFACAGTACPEQSSSPSLPDLLTRLSSPSSSPSDLPLHPDSASQPAPSLTLVIHAESSSARTVLPALAEAVGGAQPTSFVASADRFDDVENALSVKDLADVKIGEKPAVVNVELKVGETAQLFDFIRTLARGGGSSLAVLWASRQDADAPDPNAPAPAADANAPAGDAAAPPDTKNGNAMNPPEISSAGLAGLLVGLIFLLIFIPGFLCLSKITAPETFEIMDSNDMKKKMQ